jgi:hypothetical protein
MDKMKSIKFNLGLITLSIYDKDSYIKVSRMINGTTNQGTQRAFYDFTPSEIEHLPEMWLLKE